MVKHSLLKIVTAAALAVGTSLCAFAADPIKIGSVLSVTGPAAFLGDRLNGREALPVGVAVLGQHAIDRPRLRTDDRQAGQVIVCDKKESAARLVVGGCVVCHALAFPCGK